MYEQMSDHFPPYGQPEYHDRTAEPLAVLFDPRQGGGPEQQDDWQEQPHTHAGFQGFTPTAEATSMRGHRKAFVPHQRPSLDDPSQITTNAQPSRHRRAPRATAAAWRRVIVSLFGVLTAMTAATVCLLGWTFSYSPLRDIALTRAPHGLSQLWPFVVDGPWLAGCLSVLRAALQGRWLVHSWVVVVLFTGLATGLCIADVSRHIPDIIVAGLPPITAGVCVHQLARQLTSRPGARRAVRRKTADRASR